MKARVYLITFLMVTAYGYSNTNHLPKPSMLFSITEKILAQAQEFLFASTEKPVKSPKAKPVLKVKAKAPLTVPVDAVSPPEKPGAASESGMKIKRDGMFIICEP